MKHKPFLSALFVLLTLLVMAGSALPPARASVPTTTPRLADLPLPAQASIAGMLGRDADSYHVVPTHAGYRAENIAHTLSADFAAEGVQVNAGAAQWRVTLRGWGYGDRHSVAAPAQPQAAANRVEYRRGALTEWYVNGPLGLEQGFTIATAPGERNGAPLKLAIALSGGLQATVDTGENALTLTSPEGAPVLRYGGLFAYDARGRELKAWLEVQGAQAHIRVDDANAEYPLVIDPFITQAKLTASDKAADDNFGYSVAISGDTVVVGADSAGPGGTADAGAAYVFVKPGGYHLNNQGEAACGCQEAPS